jgi:hypothetical protein
MSRLSFSFDDSSKRPADQTGGGPPQPHLSLRTGIRSRKNLRRAATNTALFAFGFGSTSLIAHFSAGFLLLYFVTALRH